MLLPNHCQMSRKNLSWVDVVSHPTVVDRFENRSTDNERWPTWELKGVSASMTRFSIAYLLLISAQVMAADEWPQFRGPGGQGHVHGPAIPVTWNATENIRWKTAIPGRGHASPVITGNVAWLLTSVETPLTAAEQKQRLSKLKNSNGLEISGKLSLQAVAVDIVSGKLLHVVELLQVAEPEPIHVLNSYASPTPVLHDGRLYVHFGTYGTVCLDISTRKVVWRRTDINVDHQNGPGSSPIVWKDLLIVHCDGIDSQFVTALKLKDGSDQWKAVRSGKMNARPEFRKAYSTPVVVDVAGKDVLISPGADWTYAYDPATGRELWKEPYGQLGFSTVPRPVVGHGLVYVCTSYMKSRLLAVRYDSSGDRVAWQSDSQIPKKPSLLLVGDNLYFVNDGGVATCLDALTGEQHWRQRLGGQYSASPIFAGNRIYFFSQDGKTTVIEPGNTFRQLSVNPLGEGLMASPAAVNGALFLRGDKHLYRIETAEAQTGS